MRSDTLFRGYDGDGDAVMVDVVDVIVSLKQIDTSHTKLTSTHIYNRRLYHR